MNKFFNILFFSFTIISCGFEDNPILNDAGITSISVSMSSDKVDANESITFEAKDNNQNTVTSSCKFYVDGQLISGSTYSTATGGDHEVFATYKTIISDKKIFNVFVPPPTNYQTNVIVEDYTATWCGWCPSVLFGLEELENKTDKISIVAYHSNDIFHFVPIDLMYEPLEIRGFPTARLSRTKTWVNPPANTTQVTDLSSVPSNLGIASTSSISGQNLTLKVKVKYGSNSYSDTKLIVLLLEDDLKADQVNWTSFYSEQDPIPNYVHNNIARVSLTDIFGDDIPNTKSKLGEMYTQDFTYEIPIEYNKSKLKVVAFVVGSNKQVINVRGSDIGVTQNFEEL